MLSKILGVLPKLITISSLALLLSCNEKYSGIENGPTNQSRQPSSEKRYSQSNLMKWNFSSLNDDGLNVYVSEDLLAEFNSQDYTGEHNPIQSMLKKWNDSVSDVTFFNIESASDERSIDGDQKQDLYDYNDNVFGIYKHDDWFEEVSPSALAITQFFGKRVNIGSSSEYLELIHADIIINFKHFSFGIGYKSFEDYDLPSVILHELGHFLGLGHSGYSEESIMVPYLDVATEKRSLYEYDKNSILSLYETKKSNNSSSAIISSLAVNKNRAPMETKEEYVRGIIELNANGKCNHFINGELVHSHIKKPGH